MEARSVDAIQRKWQSAIHGVQNREEK